MSNCYQCEIIKETKEFYYNNNKYYKISLQRRRINYILKTSNQIKSKKQ